METYIFKNTGDFNIQILVEPGHQIMLLRPDEVFSLECEGFPPALERLRRRGDIDYWIIRTSAASNKVCWQKEGF